MNLRIDEDKKLLENNLKIILRNTYIYTLLLFISSEKKINNY